MKPDLSVLPIAGWEVKTVSTDELIFIRFIYLSETRQRLDEVDAGNSYAMEIEQARELSDTLVRAIERIDNIDRDPPFRSQRNKTSRTPCQVFPLHKIPLRYVRSWNSSQTLFIRQVNRNVRHRTDIVLFITAILLQ